MKLWEQHTKKGSDEGLRRRLRLGKNKKSSDDDAGNEQPYSVVESMLGVIAGCRRCLVDGGGGSKPWLRNAPTGKSPYHHRVFAIDHHRNSTTNTGESFSKPPSDKAPIAATTKPQTTTTKPQSPSPSPPSYATDQPETTSQ
ncbi:hypothetical protein CASFOL_030124 [Castilleja foliolosa]|uniref:Uncharacterized protein n=1 Tax=Castilleja foliolosa TaxID=1961234 RepID=A0ABD3CCN6_9LAMI